MTVTEVEDIRVRYPGDEQWLLSGIDLRVETGEVVLLMGPSGCGKSTVARCLNGLLPHSMPGELDGRVTVCGNDVAETPQATLTRDVGLVFQNPESQFVTSTVAEEVAFGLENLRIPRSEMDRRIEAALSRVGLNGFEQRRIERLSGGEQQRLALACQLVMEPSLLVFDEPTASLDPAGRRDVFETIRTVADRGDRSVVLIEHRCESLLDVVDRVVVLGHDGDVMVRGTPQAVFSTHAATLRTAGIWLPDVTRVAAELRAAGVWPESSPLPTTVAEAAAVLAELPPDRDALAATDRAEGTAVDADPAIEIRDLHAGYDDPDTGEVLSGVDLTVPPGSVTAVVGPNGAGKSTLARYVAGIESPPPGTVAVDGEDVTSLASSALHGRIGYVFQNPESQFVTDSVRAELRHELEHTALDTDAVGSHVDGALDRFGLAHRAEANPFALSHGEKRRLSVATMLVGDREMVILDEPTAGQDRASAEALLETIAELAATGRTVLWLTHDMDRLARYADRVAVLVDGTVRFQGRPSTLFTEDELLSRAQLSRPARSELVAALTAVAPEWASIVRSDMNQRPQRQRDGTTPADSVDLHP